MSRPPSRFTPATPQFKVNGKIRAREVRVIGPDGGQVGILDLGAALTLARGHGLDLVEIAATAVPPVCRIVDFGKFKYEQAKRERDAKKHQHANTVKEVQLTPRIDPHDLGIKMEHAVGFLCDDMKVKVALRFRGREMAHTEIGMEVIRKFLKDLGPWGHPDFEPKLVGRAVSVMISPLPRTRRAPDPRAPEPPPSPKPAPKAHSGSSGKSKPSANGAPAAAGAGAPAAVTTSEGPAAKPADESGGPAPAAAAEASTTPPPGTLPGATGAPVLHASPGHLGAAVDAAPALAGDSETGDASDDDSDLDDEDDEDGDEAGEEDGEDDGGEGEGEGGDAAPDSAEAGTEAAAGDPGHAVPKVP